MAQLAENGIGDEIAARLLAVMERLELPPDTSERHLRLLTSQRCYTAYPVI
jgi:hypothetical protein